MCKLGKRTKSWNSPDCNSSAIETVADYLTELIGQIILIYAIFHNFLYLYIFSKPLGARPHGGLGSSDGHKKRWAGRRNGNMIVWCSWWQLCTQFIYTRRDRHTNTLLCSKEVTWLFSHCVECYWWPSLDLVPRLSVEQVLRPDRTLEMISVVDLTDVSSSSTDDQEHKETQMNVTDAFTTIGFVFILRSTIFLSMWITVACSSIERTISVKLTLYNTIQYNTIQYNTIQYNTIQYTEYVNFRPPPCYSTLSRTCYDLM